jgi:hypothetical protein
MDEKRDETDKRHKAKKTGRDIRPARSPSLAEPIIDVTAHAPNEQSQSKERQSAEAKETAGDRAVGSAAENQNKHDEMAAWFDQSQNERRRELDIMLAHARA